ncbi:hypothetical protein [Trueperella pecoris]|uniref:Uncharacterized protein n=1 Tax=Trueperella pecoris TaxID=2733571 RepID=A0A7M1QW44_9ACTO|nr:hypothetical protein [Trueperella pecoris]QOR46260.1 hypothetical protein INS88_03395 [Trueperella pecoris]QTG76085.1 hypothetical protein J4179_03310 [Trueperella pecoris]
MAYLIFKRYSPQTVLLFAGLIMLGLTIVFPNTGVVRPEKWPDTGKALLDVFDHVRFLFSTTGAELGLIIMAAGLAMLLMVTVSPLAPEVAQSVGVRPVFMAQPMEFASGIGRSMSPVAGVVIAVAGLAGVNDGHRQAYGARHGRRLYHDDRLLDGMGLHRLHDSPLTEERTS